MTRHFALGALASAVSVLCSAQSAPDQTPPPATLPSVNVAAQRPVNRIDREVYDQKQDPENATTSAADALQKVPSVTVDADGSVALRGNRNVQIMVDGKPSAMLQGDNRGDALRSIPAENLDSIEVINNPGAQFGNDGGGGPILNLVMRRERRPGGYGIATGGVGTNGRRNGFASGSYNSGRWGFEGMAGVFHNESRSTTEDERESTNPATGAVARSGYEGSSHGANTNERVSGTVRYNLGDKETLDAQLTLTSRGSDSNGSTRYRRFGAGDALVDDYLRARDFDASSHSWDWRGNYERKETPEAGMLKLTVQGSGDLSDNDSDYRNNVLFTSIGTPAARNRQHVGNERRNLSTDGDYERNEAGAIMRLGYRLARADNIIDNRYFDVQPDTLAEVPNPARTNLFELTETVAAVYGEYQLRLNDRWGVKGGLRAEYTDTDLRQYTTGVGVRNHYFNTIPSFFATYKVSDDSQLRLAWSHRISRPGASALNPFVVYIDEFDLAAGNPYLKPSQSDSVELGLESKIGAMTTNLRGYLRRSSDVIVQRKVFVSPGVLLSTSENDGTNRSGGIEATVSGKLTPTVSINGSGNLGVFEQNVLDPLRPDAKRTTTALTGQFRVNWTVTPSDTLLAHVNARGRVLTGQGYTQPVQVVSTTWRHSFTSRWTGTLSVWDIFNAQKSETITDTSILHDRLLTRPNTRALVFGLSYRFGGPDGPAPGQRPPGMRPEGGHGGYMPHQ
ncbi:MAG TPA: TonB-dependent receptor [Telluria sp.]|nr:TonB-dependent receptor [Telluria sp.]